MSLVLYLCHGCCFSGANLLKSRTLCVHATVEPANLQNLQKYFGKWHQAEVLRAFPLSSCGLQNCTAAHPLYIAMCVPGSRLRAVVFSYRWCCRLENTFGVFLEGVDIEMLNEPESI